MKTMQMSEVKGHKWVALGPNRPQFDKPTGF